MPDIDRIKGFAIALTLLIVALVVSVAAIRAFNDPACDNAHTPPIVKKTMCRLG